MFFLTYMHRRIDANVYIFIFFSGFHHRVSVSDSFQHNHPGCPTSEGHPGPLRCNAPQRTLTLDVSLPLATGARDDYPHEVTRTLQARAN